MSQGKGSRRRPEDRKRLEAEWDRVFRRDREDAADRHILDMGGLEVTPCPYNQQDEF